MLFTPGAAIGPYQITSAIGAGGMGEVYRARDSRLGRDVAIKVLPEAFASDAERVARFEREAKTLASLNHAHIAQVHGLEAAGSARALVMEYVAGEDLAQRIAKGPVPLDEALSLARQIAEALEAAHDHGVIHRDLKPGNIKVTPDGTVKVLDFGLAKAVDAKKGDLDPGGSALANSPTISAHATHAGVILGTAAYMSPEQARGRVVDRRTDIWAFGCVLYEMLTGARAFPGQDLTDIVVAVVSREPDWQALPPASPPAIRRLLRRCLEKDPKKRLDSAAALRLEIDDAAAPTALEGSDARGSRPSTTAPAARGHRALIGVAGVLVGAALALAVVWPLVRGEASPPARVTRTVVSTAPAEFLRSTVRDEVTGEGRPTRTAIAVSPDGRSIVFSGVVGGRQRLFQRALDQLEATPLSGTEDGHSPFFSPDGAWIGFQSGRLLKKVAAAGGAPPTTICEAALLYGAAWGAGDTIVFATERSGLWQVAAGGGNPRPLTTLDRSQGEFSHRLPHFLPDGKAVIFTVTGLFLPNWDDARLSLVTLDDGRRGDLGPGADGQYVTGGHLVYMKSGTLVAVPFDLTRREIAGNPLTVVGEVLQAANMTNSEADTGAGQFAIAGTGDLLYVPGGVYPDREKTIVVADRRGKMEALPIPPRAFFAPHLSPDESRLVVWTQGLDRNLWTYDLARGTLTRLTSRGRNHRGIWSPDGKRITYAGGVGGAYNLFSIAADGSGPPERLSTSAITQTPSSWTPDGQTLLLTGARESASGLEYLIFALSPGRDREPRPVLESRFLLAHPELSPDGTWLAFVTNESGREEVYVQPYPGPGPRQQISTGGGVAPAWAKSGRELFYTTATTGPQRMMSVPITLTPFTAASPRVLFEGTFHLQDTTRGYSVSADGQRFYLTQMNERPRFRATQMVLVQNWAAELKRLVPTR